MQNYCLKNIQSIVFRNGFCPYQNPLIQVIHLFIIRDKITYELVKSCTSKKSYRTFALTRNLSYNKRKYVIDTKIGKE